MEKEKTKPGCRKNLGIVLARQCMMEEENIHQLPADIDMHILAYKHQRESARRADIEVKTKHTKV